MCVSVSLSLYQSIYLSINLSIYHQCCGGAGCWPRQAQQTCRVFSVSCLVSHVCMYVTEREREPHTHRHTHTHQCCSGAGCWPRQVQQTCHVCPVSCLVSHHPQLVVLPP